ncbi:MAG: hypothetical protein ABFD18_06125 [Syntrophomonas sp.]
MGKWAIEKVDNWVNNAALTPIEGFTPSAVAKNVELPIEEVYARLTKLVAEEKIIQLFELRCPQCFNKLCELTIPKFNKTCYCLDCDKDIEVNLDMFSPFFTFNSEYREYLREESKKKLQQSAAAPTIISEIHKQLL